MAKNIRDHVLDFLKESETVVISTVSSGGDPQAATVYYLADDDLNIYFATGRETQKFKNLQNNKRVAFVVGTGPAIITVQARGIAEEIDGDSLKEKGEIGSKLYFKALKEWPVLALPHQGLAFFKITPDWMTFLNLDKEGHPETYKSEYYKII